MRDRTIRRTVTAMFAAVGLVGVFAVAQPAEALPIDDYDVTIETGSVITVDGSSDDVVFTIGDPACDNTRDDDDDTLVDAAADGDCVDADDNSECNAGDSAFFQPTYDISVDDTNDNPGTSNSSATNFTFPGYEFGVDPFCVPVTLTASEPADGFYDVDHSASLPDTGRARQVLEITAEFMIPGGDVCTLGPVDTTVDTADNGGSALTPSSTPETATLTVQDVPVPAVQMDMNCSQTFADLINNTVGLPGTADVVLNITVS